VECPRIAQKHAPSFRLTPEGAPPTSPWVLVLFRRRGAKNLTRRQKLGRNRGDWCILLEAGMPKWKSRLRIAGI
jgi:hypothetical protein